MIIRGFENLVTFAAATTENEPRIGAAIGGVRLAVVRIDAVEELASARQR